MANETVVIDITARFTDNTNAGMSNAMRSVDRLGNSIKKTLQQTEKLTRDKWTMRLDMVDNVTSKISNIASKASSLAGKTFKFGVSILDYATKPLRGIFNLATSLKGIVMGVVAGKAMQETVMKPIGLADSYTSASIGFETLFNSKEKAQKMMDDLDAFAIATPFKTANVISNSQKMIAMGWNPDDIIKDMKVIGDAAASTGKGDEGFASIVRALSLILSIWLSINRANTVNP